MTIYIKRHYLIQIVESNKNKKSNQRNYISRNKSTKASPSVAAAYVVINVESATQRLNELLNTYEEKSDWSNPRGFLTDLRTALGIPNTKGASKYGVVKNEAFIASITYDTVGNPYQLIIKSIINFLHTGEYIDNTGVARKNTSPVVNNTNESK